jgi:hypothetical protein
VGTSRFVTASSWRRPVAVAPLPGPLAVAATGVLFTPDSI